MTSTRLTTQDVRGKLVASFLQIMQHSLDYPSTIQPFEVKAITDLIFEYIEMIDSGPQTEASLLHISGFAKMANDFLEKYLGSKRARFFQELPPLENRTPTPESSILSISSSMFFSQNTLEAKAYLTEQRRQNNI